MENRTNSCTIQITHSGLFLMDDVHTSLVRARLLSLPLRGDDAVGAMLRFASPTRDGSFFVVAGTSMLLLMSVYHQIRVTAMNDVWERME